MSADDGDQLVLLSALEPGAQAAPVLGTMAVLFSQAVSMKRIADALEWQNERHREAIYPGYAAGGYAAGAVAADSKTVTTVERTVGSDLGIGDA